MSYERFLRSLVAPSHGGAVDIRNDQRYSENITILTLRFETHQMAPFGAKIVAFDAELSQESEKSKLTKTHRRVANAKMCRISVSRIP